MHKETVQLTFEGKLALEAELHELQAVRRPAAMQWVVETQADNNADDGGTSADCTGELAYIDHRIHEIGAVLRHAVIISAQRAGARRGTVSLGSHVLVRDAAGDEQTWCIVDSAEANARAGKISNASPVGAALLGKRQGETVVVHVPGGDADYIIVQVR